MSFGRWLLVHSFSIFLLSLFVIGYIFRAELQLENAYHQLLNLESANTLETAQKTPSKSPVQITKQDKIEESAPEKNSPSIQPSTQPKDVYPTLSTIPTVPLARVEPSEKLNNNDRLFQARQAFWDKNYAEAIYIYRQLIEGNYNNPDYLGELGNIYYSLNDYQNASTLYYQAAQLFINQNQPDRARVLVAPIIAMNRDLGEKLKTRLKE